MSLTPEPDAYKARDDGRSVGISDVVWVVLAGVALGAVGLFLIGAVIGAFLGPGDKLSYVITFSVTSFVIYGSLFAAVYGVVIRRRNLSWEQMGLRPPKQGFISKTLGLMFGVIFSNAIIGMLVQQLFGDPPNVREQLSLERGSTLSGVEVLLLAFALVLAAPIVEEILFRGLLLPALRTRWSFWPAAAVSSLVFAIAHVSLLLMPTLFVLGLALAWLREHFDSLYPPIVLHALNNGLAVAVLVTISSP